MYDEGKFSIIKPTQRSFLQYFVSLPTHRIPCFLETKMAGIEILERVSTQSLLYVVNEIPINIVQTPIQ